MVAELTMPRATSAMLESTRMLGSALTITRRFFDDNALPPLWVPSVQKLLRHGLWAGLDCTLRGFCLGLEGDVFHGKILSVPFGARRSALGCR